MQVRIPSSETKEFLTELLKIWLVSCLTYYLQSLNRAICRDNNCFQFWAPPVIKNQAENYAWMYEGTTYRVFENITEWGWGKYERNF